MTVFDLFFLGSVVFVLVMTGRIAVCAGRRRWKNARGAARMLGIYVAAYAAVLFAVGLAAPRRFYAPGQRMCADDWCVAALAAKPVGDAGDRPCGVDAGSRVWIATAEVSSRALRVRQRANDAEAEVEDLHGKRYAPCGGPLASNSQARQGLRGEVGPGESYRVQLPFRLPASAVPAGLLVHHGDWPGALIIGGGPSWLHPPALLRFPPEDPD